MSDQNIPWVITADEAKIVADESLVRGLLTGDGAGKVVKAAILDELISRKTRTLERDLADAESREARNLQIAIDADEEHKERADKLEKELAGEDLVSMKDYIGECQREIDHLRDQAAGWEKRSDIHKSRADKWRKVADRLAERLRVKGPRLGLDDGALAAYDAAVEEEKQ